ncbi:magnesium transporter [Mycoplasmopsis gallinarum]|uniref:Magnesium transporter MgtE n=1 Tax=Mycoplasmopsis gallinarum TaxID=29557 RepID=A0A168RDF9_9BACT|nr:magnesium transporter [Mycoplasmopsis gallinarum]OAB48869.1 Mg/Co/Ni transporter MgtE [Mycoplasmopsis gallinarum]
MSDYTEAQLLEKIIEITQQKNLNEIRSLIDEVPNAQIAEVLDELNIEQQLTFLRLLKTDDAADLFSYLDEETQKNLAQSFTEEWGMKLLQELQSDELADVLDELPANVTSKILAYTSADKREELNKLLRYNDDEVGSIMSIDISSIYNTYTCEQALNKIRKDYNKNGAELVHYYYVVDSSNKLIGSLTLEEIIFAKPTEIIDEIYSPVASVSSYDKKEYAAQIFSEQDMSVLPVVNREKQLIGMITSDDVIDVINDEATDDFYKIAGINAEKNEEQDYWKISAYTLFKNRVFWNIVILLLSSVLQLIVHLTFDLFKIEALNANRLLASVIAFVPVLILIISNVIRQTYITVSRALSLQEIELKDYKETIIKEIITALYLGLALFAFNFLRMTVYHAIYNNSVKISFNNWYWYLILWTSFILFLFTFCGSIATVWILFTWIKIKKDPTNLSMLSIVNVVLIIGLAFYLLISYFIFKMPINQSIKFN